MLERKTLVEFGRTSDMKISTGTFSWMIIIGGMAMMMSCTPPIVPGMDREEPEISLQYSTVSALLTETAAVDIKTLTPDLPGATVQATKAAAETETPIPQTSPSAAPNVDQPAQSATPDIPCDLASAGKPIDLSIPDDTKLFPGQYFTKTWRLMNAGGCSWTENYAVVWFSGKQLGLTLAQPFEAPVMPGNAVDVSLEMIAPLDPGIYQSNWKLRNGQGNLFGIGPHGDAPFWVRIEVVPLATPTLTATLPLATPTPVVFARGSLQLSLDQEVDLDSGALGQAIGSDLLFRKSSEDPLFLVPENGAQIALYGLTNPEVIDCVQAPVSDLPIELIQFQEGSFICYHTTTGLPGRIFLAKADLQNYLLDLEYVTWSVP